MGSDGTERRKSESREETEDMTDIKDVQKVQLAILKEVADFCDENKITYYLYCGTLLGAIRHKGFIPWDDDTDIAMPLKDYRRFIELFNRKHPDDLELLSIDTYPKGCPIMWIKVCRKGTTFVDRRFLSIDSQWGMALDIYPLIGIHDNRRLQKIQLKAARLAGFLVAEKIIHEDINKAKDWKRKYYRLLDLPRGIRVFIIRIIRKLIFIDPSKTERMGSIDGARLAPKYDRHDFDDTITALFEDREFTIPKRYDKILKIMYGDYMKLPPLEARQGHSYEGGEMIVDDQKDYRDYVRQLKEERS